MFVKTQTTSILIPLVLGVVVLAMAYPVILIFIKSFAVNQPGQPPAWGLGGWFTAFNDRNLPSAMSNTLSLAAIRVVVSTVLALFFAWVVTRTNTPLKNFIEFMLWLGFFLPLLPMTIGWILLLDQQHGLLNKLLIYVFGMEKGLFDPFSYWGIVWCHLAFSTSIRFLLMTPAFRTMDASLEEAAIASGSNGASTLLRITLPILAPAIVVSTALGFVKSLESFELELVLGIPAGIYVLSTRIYDFAHADPPAYGAATALASIFLVVILLMICFQTILLGKREYTTITGKGYQPRFLSIGRWRWVTYGFCMLFIFVFVLLPLGALLMGTFMRVIGFYDLKDAWTTRHWATAFDDPIFVRAATNTMVLGVGAGIGGTLIYAVISYFIVRTHFFGRRVLDFLLWLPWAVPGVLIGIALLWTILGSGDAVKLLYGTNFALMLGIVIG